MRARELLEKISEYNGKGRHQATLRPLQMLLEKVPDHPRVLWEYAIALDGTGQVDEALRTLDSLHERAPKARKVWRMHARLLAKSPAEQLALIERALKHIPDDSPLLAMHREARAALAENEEASIEERMEHTELLYDYDIPTDAPPPAPASSASDDPDQAVVEQLAREIQSMQDVVDPEYRPVRAGMFSWPARRHCRRCETLLRPHGYRLLGDFTPRHLEGNLGGPILMRFMLSKDRLSVASCYQLSPPGEPLWRSLLNVILRKPSGPAIVELQSELSNGQFVITNNAGELDPFDYGPNILRQSLPADSSLHKLISNHQTRLLQQAREQGNATPREFNDLVDIISAESRLQGKKAHYRRSIGLATDGELQRILGKKFPRYGLKVRQRLQGLAAQEAA